MWPHILKCIPSSKLTWPLKIDAWKTIWLRFGAIWANFPGVIFCEGIHFSLPCSEKSWQQELLEAFKHATFNAAAGAGANPTGKKTPGPSWTPKNLIIERVCRHNHGTVYKVWLWSWFLTVVLYFESIFKIQVDFCFKLSWLLKNGCSKTQSSCLTQNRGPSFPFISTMFTNRWNPTKDVKASCLGRGTFGLWLSTCSRWFWPSRWDMTVLKGDVFRRVAK